MLILMLRAFSAHIKASPANWLPKSILKDFGRTYGLYFVGCLATFSDSHQFHLTELADICESDQQKALSRKRRKNFVTTSVCRCSETPPVYCD